MTQPRILFANAAQCATYEHETYLKFLGALETLAAILEGEKIGFYSGDDKYARNLFAAADTLPMDIVLRDLNPVLGNMHVKPEYPFSRVLDTYIDSRVKHHSFADNFAALVHYDFLKGAEQGSYADLAETYATRAQTAFQGHASLYDKVAALDKVYAINQDPEGHATDIASLPALSIKLLKQTFLDTANALLGVCAAGYAEDAVAARRILTERIEMAETIHGAAYHRKVGGFDDIVDMIEGMYLADLPPEEVAEEMPVKTAPAVDGPKPV